MKNLTLFLFGVLVLGLAACGKNAASPSAGGVSLSSKAYTASGLGIISPMARLAALPAVDEFKFCVGKVKFEDESGNAVIKNKPAESGAESKLENEAGEQEVADENGEFEFSPGLIDVSLGAAIEWGKIPVPTGYSLSRLKVKIKKDKDVCGVDYSLSFNGMTSDQDIEFKWKFQPPVEITADSKLITVSLDSIVTTLKEAAAAGAINSLKDRVEQTEDEAEKD